MFGFLRVFSRRDGEPDDGPSKRAKDGGAYWTPKGYRVPESAEKDHDSQEARLGMPGYGSWDSSPPRAGYGIGRRYD